MPMNDPTWAMSTFASVTIQFKDEEVGVDGLGEGYVSVGTPAQMDDVRGQTKMKLAETTIRAASSSGGSSLESERRPDNAILSETRIEIVTVHHDDVMEQQQQEKT
jgi:hypothetical protein